MIKKLIFSLLILSICFGCSTDNSDVEEIIEEIQETPEEEIEETEDDGILSGEFVDAAHPTSGTATVNIEQTQLNLSNFMSDDGPVLEL